MEGFCMKTSWPLLSAFLREIHPTHDSPKYDISTWTLSSHDSSTLSTWKALSIWVWLAILPHSWILPSSIGLILQIVGLKALGKNASPELNRLSRSTVSPLTVLHEFSTSKGNEWEKHPLTLGSSFSNLFPRLWDSSCTCLYLWETLCCTKLLQLMRFFRCSGPKENRVVHLEHCSINDPYEARISSALLFLLDFVVPGLAHSSFDKEDEKVKKIKGYTLLLPTAVRENKKIYHQGSHTGV